MGGHSAGVNVIDGAFRDGVRVIANFVFVMSAVFADVIGDDASSIL